MSLIKTSQDERFVEGNTTLVERSDTFDVFLGYARQTGPFAIEKLGGDVAVELADVFFDSYAKLEKVSDFAARIANQDPPILLPDSFYFHSGVLAAIKEMQGVQHV